MVKRDGKDVVVQKGNTFENADNLAQSALDLSEKNMKMLFLGRQELYAEIIDEVEGALWNMKMIDNCRIEKSDIVPEMTRVVVAIDRQCNIKRIK